MRFPARAIGAMTLLACQGQSDEADEPFVLAHVTGASNAPVSVVEYGDFGCPYCKFFSDRSFPALKEQLVDSGLVRWQYMPVLTGRFRNAMFATVAAECVAAQNADLFWEMKSLLFLTRQYWTHARDRRDAEAFLRVLVTPLTAAGGGLGDTNGTYIDVGLFAKCQRIVRC